MLPDLDINSLIDRARSHTASADALIFKVGDRHTAQWATEGHDLSLAEAHQRQAALYLNFAAIAREEAQDVRERKRGS